MSDVIRLAAHAHHYLAIFDKGTALALYHTKPIASPAQRIMLHATERGCRSSRRNRRHREAHLQQFALTSTSRNS